MTDQDKLDWAYSIISNALEQTSSLHTEPSCFCSITCGENRKPVGCPWFYENGGFRCYRNDAQHLIAIMENGDE